MLFIHFVSINNHEHGEEADGTIQQNRLNNAAVQKEELGLNRQVSEFAYSRESLLAVFINVRGVLIEAEVIVQCDAEIFGRLHLPHLLPDDEDTGRLGRGARVLGGLIVSSLVLEMLRGRYCRTIC